MGEYDMHGNVVIDNYGKANFQPFHDEQPVSWTLADGKQATARGKWGYCHGLSTKQGEGEHGIPAGQVQRCCPFDLDVYDELPGTSSRTKAQLEVLRTPAAVGERWGQLVEHHDALAERYAAELAKIQWY